MADWDPFADPADSSSTVDTEGGDRADAEQSAGQKGPSLGVGLAESAPQGARDEDREPPLNPWEDEVYVELSREAAREVAEQEAAAKETAAQAATDAQSAEREASEREVAERARRVAARDVRQAAEAHARTPEEQRAAARRARIEDAAFREAMEAARNAPRAVAAKREATVKEFYEQEASGASPAGPEAAQSAAAAAGADAEEGEVGFREAAAHMMAAQMGVKIKFRSMAPMQLHAVGLLFPDQGSRSLRLLSAARNLPGVPQMLDSARRILGFDPLEEVPIRGVWELFRGPEAIPVWLEDTALCQPVMFLSAMAAVERLKERKPGCLDRCQAVAGLSLGELAALTFAGVFDFETGLLLARARGEAMQAAAAAPVQRMLSVAGLRADAVEALCAEARRGSEKEGEEETCQIAQRLFPDGFIVSGTAGALERLLPRARAAEGCKQATLLKAAGTGAFHTPVMEPARESFREVLAQVQGRMRPPRVDVYLGVTGRPVRAGSDPAEIATLLCDQITHCVLWETVVRSMLQDGVAQFFECGPMQQLKGIMKRIDETAFGTMLSVDHVVKNVKEAPPRGPPR